MTDHQWPVLIARKRDGGELGRDEVLALVEAHSDGRVSDAQMAAWMMAGLLNGFTDAETVALTDALVASGDVVDLSGLPGPTVDKHSTGGVGDTTTLVVAPLLAALGCQVAKLSGRGLGHTGGTLDKLESVPGYRVDLTPAQLVRQVTEVGVAVAAATGELAPADKRLYALRDVTGTVPSEALIAASVMSKKIAGGAHHVVLDVKAGDGAFMPDVASASALARRCVALGRAVGREVSAVVTDMGQPLGPAIGNALEVRAAVDVLAGGGDPRLRSVCVTLAAEALVLAGLAADPGAGADAATTALDDGRAMATFEAWIAAQGGDARVASDPAAVLPSAPVLREWRADDGHVAAMATRRLGELAGRLGAGRSTAGAAVDPAVGLVVHLDVGAPVPDGPSVVVHARDEDAADEVVAMLPDVVEVTDVPVEPTPLVLAHVRDEEPS